MKIRSLVLAIAIAAASLDAAAQLDCSDLAEGPAAPQEEAMTLTPGAGFIWMPGYWDCQGDGYQWVGGGWMRDVPGYVWERHHWERDLRDRWHLQPGHWREDPHGARDIARAR